jgi:hypothetical protein
LSWFSHRRKRARLASGLGGGRGLQAKLNVVAARPSR